MGSQMRSFLVPWGHHFACNKGPRASEGSQGGPRGSKGSLLGAFGEDFGRYFWWFFMISWCMLGVISEHFPSWLLLNSLQLFYLGSLLSGKICIKYSELVGTGFSNCWTWSRPRRRRGRRPLDVVRHADYIFGNASICSLWFMLLHRGWEHVSTVVHS